MTFPYRLPTGFGCLAFAMMLSGCAARLNDARPQPGAWSETVMGNYEAIAGCVAEASQKSATSAATLRLDRSRKIATLSRPTVPPTEGSYDMTFTQAGVATVQVEARDTSANNAGARVLAFMRPQVGICATNLTAP